MIILKDCYNPIILSHNKTFPRFPAAYLCKGKFPLYASSKTTYHKSLDTEAQSETKTFFY